MRHGIGRLSDHEKVRWNTVATQAGATATTVRPADLDAVTTAFAFGWQMARLYSARFGSTTTPSPDDDLPGLSALPPATRVELGLAQADAALNRLTKRIISS